MTTSRQLREERATQLVVPKGSKPLTRREIDYRFRNERAKRAAGFVDPPADDPYERHVREFRSGKIEPIYVYAHPPLVRLTSDIAVPDSIDE